MLSIALGALAVGHAAVAVLAAMRSRALRVAWAVLAWLSLVVMSYAIWVVVHSATYVAAVYGTLGQGVGAVLALTLTPVILLTLPFALWGIAATRWPWTPRVATRSALIIGVVGAALLTQAHSAAAVEPVSGPDDLEATLASLSLEAPGSRAVLSNAPIECAEPLDGPTVIVTWQGEPTGVCLQGDDIEARLKALPLRAPVKVDRITGVQALTPPFELLAGLALRPGLDGACAGQRCLTPWQLLARDLFVTHTPLPFIPDLRLGLNPAELRQALEVEGQGLDGLVRFETDSWLVDEHGVLPLARAHRREVPVDTPHLTEAAEAAEIHILGAQQPDGHFRYTLDPFSGAADNASVSLARQAGTTLALCELGGEKALAAAARSLEFMAAQEHRISEEVGALIRTHRDGPARLGATALPLIAFAACRPRTGPGHDALIGRLAGYVLAMQRARGDFYPTMDRTSGAPNDGPSPLYAGGQAVFGLVLVEAIGREHAPADLPDADPLAGAAERAMDFFAQEYWSAPLRDLFFIEENWHCLAARAAIETHPHAGYEQLCLDYVAFKGRMVLDEESDVAPDLVGGLGFGNVVPPQTTPSAGQAEALAAALFIRSARNNRSEADELAMRRILGFLLRQQWDVRTCFACKKRRYMVGGWSESPGSTISRIDYVQHAWSALGHGGRALGLLHTPSPGD